MPVYTNHSLYCHTIALFCCLSKLENRRPPIIMPRDYVNEKTNTLIAILFTCLSVTPLSLYADGTYYIDKDENGFYMQTDGDGAWYVFLDDVKAFEVGEKGTYSIRTDQDGSYIVTDKHGELYINRNATEQLAQEIMGYNRKCQWQAEQRKCKVVIKGNRVLVPVVLGYGGNEIEVFLLLDTGASITALHKDIADQLDIRSSHKAKLRVIGGKTFTSNITKLNYVNVGPLKKTRYICSHH